MKFHLCSKKRLEILYTFQKKTECKKWTEKRMQKQNKYEGVKWRIIDRGIKLCGYV